MLRDFNFGCGRDKPCACASRDRLTMGTTLSLWRRYRTLFGRIGSPTSAGYQRYPRSAAHFPISHFCVDPGGLVYARGSTAASSEVLSEVLWNAGPRLFQSCVSRRGGDASPTSNQPISQRVLRCPEVPPGPKRRRATLPHSLRSSALHASAP